MTIQVEAIDQCIYVELFIMLFMVVLTFNSVDDMMVFFHILVLIIRTLALNVHILGSKRVCTMWTNMFMYRTLRHSLVILFSIHDFCSTTLAI